MQSIIVGTSQVRFWVISAAIPHSDPVRKKLAMSATWEERPRPCPRSNPNSGATAAGSMSQRSPMSRKRRVGNRINMGLR